MIILDTSALIDLFRGGNEILRSLEGDVASTAISYHEIYVGIKRQKARAEERFFRRLFSEIKILNLDRSSAERSSEIMSRLLALGISVNSMDVLIAGIAEANGAQTLITRDRDFESIAKVAELDIKVY
ncbi:MAG: type II toxin-antitoxin system VapC family toxin [Methanothrix sp.]|nr:type II toxin-antitoxin system VapC family toxin [Methanothrix sp.]